MPGVAARATAVRGFVTPVGYGVLLLGASGFVGHHYLGHEEMLLVGTTSLVLLVVALPFVLLPTRVKARLALRSTHTVAGDTGRAVLHVRNRSPLPLLSPEVRIPIGRDATRLRLPLLRRDVEHAETITVPTFRRGVIDVGPATARRTDPLGLLRREARWGEPVQLYVRPRMAALDAMTSGFLREREGIPSDRVSMNDLAFHALREYVRGDDLRHVHWRSSARAGQLLVRQYHQTRRNHATVIVDDARESYRFEEDFELAVSIAASLVARCALDDTDLTFVCGTEFLAGHAAPDILDACCRVDLGDTDLTARAEEAAFLAPDTSLLLVTGGRAAFPRIASVQRAFPLGSRPIFFHAHPSGRSMIGDAGGFPKLTVSVLEDLPRLLAGLTEERR